MEYSINSILESIDAFLVERASREYRAQAGLAPPAEARALFADFARLVQAEAVAWVHELAGSDRLEEPRRARLRVVEAFLVDLFAGARAAPSRDTLDAGLRACELAVAGRRQSPTDTLRELPRLQAREARDEAEKALGAALGALAGPWSDAAEAYLQSFEPLGLASPTALLERVQGRRLDASIERANELLRLTEDGYRDLLAHALKRVGPSLKPRDGRLHDVLRAAAAPWFDELLPSDELEHAVTRCLGDMGLDPNARGRIVVDLTQERRGSSWARLFPIRVPDELRLCMTAGSGFEAWSEWLASWGQAQHHALVARTAAFVDRALGDAAVPRAIGLLFEGWLADAGWLRRYARLNSAQAIEVARLAAFRQTVQARLIAASVLTLGELLARGPGGGLDDSHQSFLRQHLLVTPPTGRAVVDVDPSGTALWELDARALRGHLATSLRERFDDDFWRNPATGRWLAAFAAAGQRESSATIAAATEPRGLTMADEARRLVAVMGA